MLRRVFAPLFAFTLLASCATPDPVPGDVPPPRLLRRLRAHGRFKVRVTAPAPRVDRSLSLADIALLPGALKSPGTTQGLTLMKHGMATHTRFTTAVSASDQRVAAWFEDVIVTVTISSTTIYVPSEYPARSCQSDAVLAHEREHWRLAREHASRAARRVEEALAAQSALPTRWTPLVAAEANTAAARLKELLARYTQPAYVRFETELLAAHAELDDPRNYRRVYNRCWTWRK